MARFLLTLLLVNSACTLTAQDTLRVMTYNLLNYGNTGNSNYCDLTCKDQQLATIVATVDPDILVVNEVADQSILLRRIEDNSLNINGETKWDRAPYTNVSSSNLVNGCFYDTDKVVLVRTEAEDSNPRDINFYTFYYRGDGLASGDTVFFRVAVAHFKADGQGGSDEATRGANANTIMQHLNENTPLSFELACGDFNLKTSSEPAWDTLTKWRTNPSIRFQDPVNRVGSWAANSSFADVHTQSTRTSSQDDGGSSGGCDDRFDFILVSSALMNASSEMHYVAGTYTATNQDGTFFDNAVTSATTGSTGFKSALLRMSDHLPVQADFAVSQSPAVGTSEVARLRAGTRLLGNPTTTDFRVRLDAAAWGALPVTAQVLSTTGQVVWTGELPTGAPAELRGSQGLPMGAYVVRIGQGSQQTSLRVIKR